MDSKTACRGGVGSQAIKFLNKISFIKTCETIVYSLGSILLKFHRITNRNKV